MSGYGFTNAGTTYDDEDRLTGYQRTNGALSQSWNLTSVGDWNSVTTNGTAQSRTHGPTHELLTAGGQTVNTDVKGNITLLPTALSSLASTALGMSWDLDNKLKSVDVGNNSSTDVEYKYDALGRRVARVGSSGSFVYVQSDQQTIADYGVGDAPSSPLYRYVYASYIDEPVVRKGAGTGGTIHYYHRNQQYSITAVTTSAGAIAERYAYSAYGEPAILDGSGTVLSISSINNRYTYTGREWDGTVGLYHFRARWMSPKTGRFLGRDPIGFDGSPWNTFEFIHGRILQDFDPFGLRQEPYYPGVQVLPTHTNCAGFALHPKESAINPVNGIDGMVSGMGFSCTLGVGAFECVDNCSKGKNCVQGYVYVKRAVASNPQFNDSVEEALRELLSQVSEYDPRVKDVQSLLYFHWEKALEFLSKRGLPKPPENGGAAGTAIDFHFMKCKPGPGFDPPILIAQPCFAPKGGTNPISGCRDIRNDPEVFVPSPEEPERFPGTRTLLKMCCCKK